MWTGLYEHIGETRLWDSVLGISCIVVLLLLRVHASPRLRHSLSVDIVYNFYIVSGWKSSGKSWDGRDCQTPTD